MTFKEFQSEDRAKKNCHANQVIIGNDGGLFEQDPLPGQIKHVWACSINLIFLLWNLWHFSQCSKLRRNKSKHSELMKF